MRRGFSSFGLLALVAATAGCAQQEMADQPRYKPLEASPFFADGRAARPLPEGTVARGWLRTDRAFYTGRSGDVEVDRFPFPVTRAVLERGRERFNIHCSPCHGHTGAGDGMIVQRGFRQPPSFQLERLRDAPVGHFYDVITNGFGAMYSYASRIPPADRWAIAAYIRALQFSQNAPIGDLTAEDLRKLEASK